MLKEGTFVLGEMPTTEQTAVSFEENFMTKTTYGDGDSELVGQFRDLLIIVDSSGSVGSSAFSDTKIQLARLVGFLCPLPDPFKEAHQLALLRYSSSVSEVFDFSKYTNTAGVQSGIAGMSYSGGSTCTASAFDYAKNAMFDTGKGKQIFRSSLVLVEMPSICATYNLRKII